MSSLASGGGQAANDQMVSGVSKLLRRRYSSSSFAAQPVSIFFDILLTAVSPRPKEET